MRPAAASARPEWLRVRAPSGETVGKVAETLRRYGLRTVCREARCPNVGECWGEGTATVLILGGTCTRNCAFCSVTPGTPSPPDPGEPARVAGAAVELGWRHVVVTSVTRDDLRDGGASAFVAAVEAIRRRAPGTAVELLVPDFQGNTDAIAAVVAARPDLLAHNVETVPRLYPLVRPQAEYRRSLSLLSDARGMDPGLPLKSGLMVGFGERQAEVVAVMEDLFAAGCRSLTVGQYLPPSRNHLPVKAYLELQEFERIAEIAREIGFPRVSCGPLVRSSYKAGVADEAAERRDHLPPEKFPFIKIP